MRRFIGILTLGLPLLIQAGYAADVTALIKVLRDPAADVSDKGAACSDLMNLGPAAAPAVPALIPLLSAPEEILRDYAVSTLAAIGPGAKSALPALQQVAATDSAAEIRGLARGAIARISTGGISGIAAPPEPPQPPSVPEPPASPPSKPLVASSVAITSPRPPLVFYQGHNFSWSMPSDWNVHETNNGVTLTASDGVTSVSSVLLLRSPGAATPKDFLLHVFVLDQEFSDVHVLGVENEPDQPSGLGVPWKVQEVSMSYNVNGSPVRANWTVGTVGISGAFDAFLLGYQTPPAAFESAKLWLAPVAMSVTITNPASVAGNDTLITPKNHPLDNSGLMESWRQKGLSNDRIAKAQQVSTMGYERMKDPATGRVYNMPLESWDDTAGGYRNPQRPTELLQSTQPGE